jgi:hypothetical protein
MQDPDPETKLEIESTWSRARIPSDIGTAQEFLKRMIEAERWCTEQFSDEQFFKYGASFYFERDEDCFQFKLIWL